MKPTPATTDLVCTPPSIPALSPGWNVQLKTLVQSWTRLFLLTIGLFVMGSQAQAWQIISVSDCDDRTFTLNVRDFPDGAYVVTLNDTVLQSVFDFPTQTFVVNRPEGLPGGTYRIVIYQNGNWVADGSFEICDIDGESNITPGGRTKGFWSNKNGQALITSEDLQALRDFCLRNGDGSDFDPASKENVKTFLRGARAKNMANMLSAQLIATYLNTVHGFTDPDVVVDGTRTVADLIAYADELLCADGSTPAKDANRAEQERVKSILDAINNGASFD